MRWNFNLFSVICRDAKQIPENQHITDFLSQSQVFRKFSMGIHNLKLKFWRSIDQAAFPENYKNDKFIDHKKKYK